MICIVSNILNPKRLASISHGIRLLCKSRRHLISKFSRISSNTGYLVAGCCFSRQSEDEPLLTNLRGNDNSLNKSEQYTRPYLEVSREATDSFNMKRRVEFVNGIVEQTAESENALDCMPEPACKKIKNSFDEPQELLETIQQKCSIQDITNAAPTSTGITGSLQYSKNEKPKKQRPNYFVAIKISDDQIHTALKGVQDHILEQEERLKKSMIELKTLHITLMVMYIDNVETHARALKALEKIHLQYDECLSKDPLLLEFKGLSHFQNRVLYAKLSNDAAYDRLSSLVKSVKQHFASASIDSTDTREGFTPHLTVTKIDFKKKRYNPVKKIDPLLYKDFTNHYFGSQKVESIQLLSMMNPKTEAGYYSGDEIYFSAFNPSNRISCLNKLLAVEEKKKNVREIINVLAKEKLK